MLKGETVIPLELNIYSPGEEQFRSENEEVIKPIEAIAHRSGFKGKYVLERGFDRDYSSNLHPKINSLLTSDFFTPQAVINLKPGGEKVNYAPEALSGVFKSPSLSGSSPSFGVSISVQFTFWCQQSD